MSNDDRIVRALEQIARCQKEFNKAVLKIHDTLTHTNRLMERIAELLPPPEEITLDGVIDEHRNVYAWGPTAVAEMSKMIPTPKQFKVESDVKFSQSRKIDPRSFTFTKADSVDDCSVCGKLCVSHSWEDRVACAKAMNGTDTSMCYRKDGCVDKVACTAARKCPYEKIELSQSRDVDVVPPWDNELKNKNES